MTQRGKVAVIGGGMAGTAAAYRLKTMGFAPTVFETRDRVGGRMRSLRKGDFLIDAGMSAYLGTYREAIELIHEVGLGPKMSDIPAIGASMRGNRKYHFDFNKPISAALTTGILSWRSKIKAIRLALDTIRNRASLGYSDYTKLAAIDTEKVGEYSNRALNDELYNYVAPPFGQRHLGRGRQEHFVALLFWTIRKMLAPSAYNLNDGVMALSVALAEHVEVRYAAPVEQVEDLGGSVDVNSNGRTETFHGCVIATTAEPALGMFPQMDATTRDLYSTTRYRKLGNIAIGFSDRRSDPATYYLPTPPEEPDTIAIIADHNKAPCRAPDGKSLFTVLLPHEYLERSEHLSDGDVLDYALDRAQKYYGVSPARLGEHNVVRWPESVSNLDKGRFKQIADYTARIVRSARVQFASDLDRTPGCNGALVSGQDAATRLALALDVEGA